MSRATIVVAGLHTATRLQESVRRLGFVVVPGIATLLAVIGIEGAVGTPIAAAQVQMIGSMSQYPDLAMADARDRSAVSGLFRATWAAAGRFDSVQKAQALGYAFDPSNDSLGWPSVRHMRKHGVEFWGRLLDPTAPQSLVWWCRAPGQCTLVASMYRAPAYRLPDTFGGLLAWHRHQTIAGWMTHIWLTRSLEASLARCAPLAQLAVSRGITPAKANWDFPMDAPCTKTGQFMSMSGSMSPAKPTTGM